VSFETSDVPRNASVVWALQDRLALILPRVSSVQAALAALSATGPLTGSTLQAIEAVSQWARATPGALGALPSDTESEARGAVARLTAESEGGTEWSLLLRRTIAAQLGQLVTELSEAAWLADALKDPDATSAPGPRLEPPSPRTLAADHGLAPRSAVAAVVGTLIACGLWIQGSWPEGAVAAQFAAIGCTLFATVDNPPKVLFVGIVGVLLALPVAALYEFAIFPRIDGFASLALVLTPMLLLFSWMQTSERLAIMGFLLALSFAGGLALQESYRPDFASFINTNTAEIAGLAIAAVVSLILATIDPIWNAARISKAAWIEVARLAEIPNSDIRSWTLRMFDRLGLVLQRLLAAERKDLVGPRIDGLRDLRVGINLATLKRSSEALPGAVRQSMNPVLDAVADAYLGLARGKPLVCADSARAIDQGLAVLGVQAPTQTMEDAVTALVGLRLDLAAFGSRYQPQSPHS